ncbi:MAG: DEAD/DEAH box helicase [Clostridia bacterium]|nr:DEAD/DEAH box helicase [Clostridia bacterium]
MADFKDIKRLCREYNVRIINAPSPDYNETSLAAYPDDRKLYIPDEWYNAEEDDELFEILKYIGWIIVDTNTDYKREKESVLWAIGQAATLNIHISHSMVVTTQSELDNYNHKEDYLYNFDSIAIDHTLQELMEMYKFPFFVQKPSWSPNFYFRAEYMDSNGWIRGTAFRNGKEYLVKEYNYKPHHIMHIYGENNVVSEDDIDYNNNIKNRIKADDGFEEVKTDDDFLFNYQRAGLLLSERYNKFAFFFDTGTGKTIMTLSVIKKKFKENNARFLIIAPKAIIRTAWMEDSERYFPTLKIAPLSSTFYFSDYKALYDRWVEKGLVSKNQIIPQKEWGHVADYEIWTEEILEKKQELVEKVINIADHYIVNIERFRMNPDEYIDNYYIDGLIIDESAILKNPGSKSAKEMFHSADSFDYIYLLSGKPAPNNSTEYYAQMKLVDPNAFSMPFQTFKKQFFTGSGSKTTFISSAHEKKVADLISRRSLTISKEDCISLPDVLHEKINIELPHNIMKKYIKLFNDCIIEIKKQDNQRTKANMFYSTSCRLAVFTKLREVASGFMMDEYKQIADLHDKKIEAIVVLAERNIDEQMVIWCQFEHEIKSIERALQPYGKVVTAYGKTKNIDQSIKQFQNKEAKYIIAHPKSIKYGVTFTNCCISVYYAMSYSAEDYYQSRDRIYRYGQKRNCTYYYLLSKGTIDEIMYDCVLNKMSYAEVFAEIIKRAAKHGINYSEFKNDNEIPDESIATQIVKEKYGFVIQEDNIFTYYLEKEYREGFLYNKLLSDKQVLNPEEVLFEIGNNILLDNKEIITYADISEVAKWVLNEMKNLHIKRIQKVYDYLEEQICKQYEIDVANGSTEVIEMERLSLSEKKEKFSFGKLK